MKHKDIRSILVTSEWTVINPSQEMIREELVERAQNKKDPVTDPIIHKMYDTSGTLVYEFKY